MPRPTNADAVAIMRSHLGAQYVYGAAGPRFFDCSGLMQYGLHQIGIEAPRTSEEQYVWVQRVSGPPQPGDLVFFVGAELDPPPGHVGMVIAPGKMIDAPHTGTVVQINDFSENGTGVEQFMGYGRIPGLVYSGMANQYLIKPGRQGHTNKQEQQTLGGMTALLSYMAVGVLIVIAFLGLLGVGWILRKT